MAVTSEPFIRLTNVGKSYQTKNGAVEACSDINLDIRQSEFVAIVGPSGCGKTTIMKMVAGLQPYTAGTITVGGKTVDRPQTDVAQVDHVLREGALQLLVHHRVTAELHHDDAVVEGLQPGQRLDQRLGLRRRIRVVAFGGFCCLVGACRRRVHVVRRRHQLAYALFSCT